MTTSYMIRSRGVVNPVTRDQMFDDMQRHGLRYSELQGHLKDVDAGHVVTAEDGTEFFTQPEAVKGLVYISIVQRPDGGTDVEVLDSKPTQSFIDGLDDALMEGTAVGYTLREGFINGGDSVVYRQAWK